MNSGGGERSAGALTPPPGGDAAAYGPCGKDTLHDGVLMEGSF